MDIHTGFRFHPRVTQVGTWWGAGGHTELYVVEGESLAVIDTGCRDAPDRYLQPALESMGRGLAQVTHVLNTHGHFHHAGGDARAGAPVYMAAGDRDLAADLDLQFDECFAIDYLAAGQAGRLDAARERFKQTAEPARVDHILEDGDVIDLGKGVALRVIHSPGHSAGSVCFFWEREGILITGDSVCGAGSRPGAMPVIFDPERYGRSVARLATIDSSVLCLGHHYRVPGLTPDSIKFRDDVAPFLRASLEADERISQEVFRAIQAHPGAGLRVIVAAALKRLVETLDVAVDAATGLPQWGGVSAVYSNWRRFGGGPLEAASLEETDAGNH